LLIGRLLIGPGCSQSLPVFWRNLRRDAAITAGQVLLGLTFMAYHAWQTTHAVVLTLVRLMFTRRRLLEWETAAVTAARSAGLVGRRGLRQFEIEMMASPIIAVSVALLIAVARASARDGSPFLWGGARTRLLAEPAHRPRERPLSEPDRALRATARRTRRFRDVRDGRGRLAAA
jgi:cyclic beta-1,2-glucan synthetase